MKLKPARSDWSVRCLGVMLACSGAAYVFIRSGRTWNQQSYLKASNTSENDLFGFWAALSCETVVVGANNEDSIATGVDGDGADNGAPNAGAAYVFVLVPCAAPGDLNCDCAVDLDDVPPFVQALVDPTGYDAAYPDCSILNGDMQPDGMVNGEDAQRFVELLIP